MIGGTRIRQKECHRDDRELAGDVDGFDHFTHQSKLMIFNTQHLGDVRAMHVKV